MCHTVLLLGMALYFCRLAKNEPDNGDSVEEARLNLFGVNYFKSV